MSVEPFVLDVPQSEIDDLHRRLDETRWPERETVDDMSQGIGLAFMQQACDYWRHRYDWRRCEAMLNGLGQFRTTIDGIDVHFIHVRSPEPDALPMVMTHGWPGSVIEFMKVIGPLTDPVAHGGRAEDAFHLVVPSLPGYGFSGKPAESGWGASRTGRAWGELMRRLGYERYVAQGGDWGSMVAAAMGHQQVEGLAAIHINMLPHFPTPDDVAQATPDEKVLLDRMAAFRATGSGYSAIQYSRPQTIAYGLVDSPVLQAAWILEKFFEWTDAGGDPLSVLTMDEMLDNVMLYWLTGTGGSSGRKYWEGVRDMGPMSEVHVPMGASMFPAEQLPSSRRWAERRFSDIIYWNEPPRGGHFAAFEQPAIFVDEVRACFALVR